MYYINSLIFSKIISDCEVVHVYRTIYFSKLYYGLLYFHIISTSSVTTLKCNISPGLLKNKELVSAHSCFGPGYFTLLMKWQCLLIPSGECSKGGSFHDHDLMLLLDLVPRSSSYVTLFLLAKRPWAAFPTLRSKLQLENSLNPF